MDVLMAAFRLVHDAPGGAVALAPLLGKTPATLSHEVSPTYPSAKLGLADAVALSEWRADRGILNAFAARMSCMVVPLVADVPGAENAATLVAGLAREFGELMAECSADLADGSVTDTELARIDKEGAQLIGALQALMSEVRAINQAGKAAGPGVIQGPVPPHLQAELKAVA